MGGERNGLVREGDASAPEPRRAPRASGGIAVSPTRPGWSQRIVVVVAAGGDLFIGAGAFRLSFASLVDLAQRAGLAADEAWVWPLIVDGLIVVATVAVVAMDRHGRKATLYPWALLIGAAVVSVTANSIHALVAPNVSVPAVIAGSVGAVPPLVLLGTTHLTVELVRWSAQPIARSRRQGQRRSSAQIATRSSAALGSRGRKQTLAKRQSFENKVSRTGRSPGSWRYTRPPSGGGSRPLARQPESRHKVGVGDPDCPPNRFCPAPSLTLTTNRSNDD